MFTRILVPIDFSPASDAALDYARMLSATFGSALQLLHVIDDPTGASEFVPDGFAVPTEELRTGLAEHARKRLGTLMSVVDRSRLHAHAETLFGTPAQTIVDYATATSTDLIVMGTHGRTGLAHLLMGSVAEQVVRTAPCPVLTVRQVAVADDLLLTPVRVPIPVAV
jgi:universal stress protein A